MHTGYSLVRLPKLSTVKGRSTRFETSLFNRRHNNVGCASIVTILPCSESEKKRNGTLHFSNSRPKLLQEASGRPVLLGKYIEYSLVA